MLPADHLDVGPGNFVDVATVELVFIDDEWQVDGGVDLELRHVRALWVLGHRIVTSGIAAPLGPGHTVGEVFDDLAELPSGPAAPDLFELRGAEVDLRHGRGRGVGRDVRDAGCPRSPRPRQPADLELASSTRGSRSRSRTRPRPRGQGGGEAGQGAHYTGLLAEHDADLARRRTLRGGHAASARSSRLRRLGTMAGSASWA